MDAGAWSVWAAFHVGLQHGRHCDVVSVKSYPWVDMENGVVYGGDPSKGSIVAMKDRWREICRHARRPVFVSEWSFVSKDEVSYAALTEMFTRIHREHFNGKINKEK